MAELNQILISIVQRHYIGRVKDSKETTLFAQAYAWRNKCVFNLDQKRSSDSCGFRMSSGSEFQTTGPETRKLLGPKLRVLARGTVRSPRIADRRWALAPTARTGMQVRVRLRYDGPRSWRALWAKFSDILGANCSLLIPS